MKNKTTLLILILMFLLSLTACGSADSEPAESTAAVTETVTAETDSDDVVPANADGENVIIGEVAPDTEVFVLNISINPEAELSADAETGVILSIACLNEDAEKLIVDGQLDLLNLPYDEAAEKFILACADEGYLNAENNDISVEIVQGEAADEILDEYNTKMEAVYTNVDVYTDFDIAVHMECPGCHGTGSCDLCGGEGKYLCSVCQGTAGSPCSDCEGDGLIPCPYCNGTGGCQACGKTGVVTCDKCGGTGCDSCGGTGTMECKSCHGHPLCEGCEDEPGSGYHHCNSCAGTGKTSCYRCNGTGYETCPRCNGDGLCANCHGEKEIGN